MAAVPLKKRAGSEPHPRGLARFFVAGPGRESQSRRGCAMGLFREPETTCRCHRRNAFSVPFRAAFPVSSHAGASEPERLVAGRLIGPAPIDASISRWQDRRRAVKSASSDDSALSVDPGPNPREPPAVAVHPGQLWPNATPCALRDRGAGHRRAHQVLAVGRPKRFVSFPVCAARRR
jgi:hypothetical protein